MPTLKNNGQAPDDDLTHAQMGEQFEDLGSKMVLDDTVNFDLEPGDYQTAPVDVEMLHNNPAKLGEKPWSSYYRGRLKGMDELVSTATVREVAKGMLKGKKPTPKQMVSLSKFINNISRVRLPTGGSGYRFKGSNGRVMQHPSSKKLLAWGSSGQNHGEADRVRRQVVLNRFKYHVNNRSDMRTTLRGTLGRAMSHTLNAFTAPLTAKNLEKLNTINQQKALKQAQDREWVKRQAKFLGVKQNVTGNRANDREWRGDDSSVISEDRDFGPEFEKKVKAAFGDVQANPATPSINKGKKTAAKPVKITKVKTTGAAGKIGKQSKVQKQMKKQQQKLIQKNTSASLRPKRNVARVNYKI